ncbi:MAG: (2Fe-2S)-binding protein [Candidatus Limnocylindrales bacterium]
MIEQPVSESATATDEWLSLTLTVNGQTQHVRARTQHTLLDVLRDRVGLIDTREGCGVGMCGACTVLVDNRIVSGCLMLAAQADGRNVVTVEGLAPAQGELHPIQEAFIEHTGFQCSYCTPGFIVAAKALLDETPEADADTARAYLAGNLCRCGSYVKILDAVMDARERVAGVDGTAAGGTNREAQISTGDGDGARTPVAG